MNQVIQVDVTVLTFIAGSLVPLITGLATKINAASKLKALVNLSISILSAAVAYAVAHEGAFDTLGLLSAIITTYLSSGVTYQNLWKPTGAATAVQEISPGTGIGA